MTKLPSVQGTLVVFATVCLAVGTIACGTRGDGARPDAAKDKEAVKPASAPVNHKTLRLQHGTIVGPDGKPVALTRVYGIKGDGPGVEALETADFAFTHAKAGTVDTLIFVNEAKRLGATLDVKGDEREPLRVRLQPTGTVVGCLVADGQPRADVNMQISYLRKSQGGRLAAIPHNGRIRTGSDGRFRLEGLVPGVEYKLEVPGKGGPNTTNNFVFAPWWKIKSGQVDDWGDVTERAIGEDYQQRKAARQPR